MRVENFAINDLSLEITKLAERVGKLEGSFEAMSGATRSGYIILSVVPLVAVTLAIVLLFFFFLWQYRLRKALIASNQYKPASFRYLKVLSLLGGLALTAMGLPMSLLFMLKYGVSNILLVGIIPFSMGVALLIFYTMTRHQDDSLN